MTSPRSRALPRLSLASASFSALRRCRNCGEALSINEAENTSAHDGPCAKVKSDSSIAEQSWAALETPICSDDAVEVRLPADKIKYLAVDHTTVAGQSIDDVKLAIGLLSRCQIARTTAGHCQRMMTLWDAAETYEMM